MARYHFSVKDVLKLWEINSYRKVKNRWDIKEAVAWADKSLMTSAIEFSSTPARKILV